MTKFYTIIGFDPHAFTEMSSSDYRYTDKHIRTYKALHTARVFRTRMANKGDGFTYKILLTVIETNGVPTVDWVE